MNGFSGDALHDSVVITVQKTDLKTTELAQEELGVWVRRGLCLLTLGCYPSVSTWFLYLYACLKKQYACLKEQ